MRRRIKHIILLAAFLALGLAALGFFPFTGSTIPAYHAYYIL